MMKKQQYHHFPQPLEKKYPPSKPCSCSICVSYCKRPGWWTVDQARRAIEAGYAFRMMLEVSPEFNIAVLSPAFKGNEIGFALKIYSDKSCTFLNEELCEVYDSGFLPLECSFCHHEREGLGLKCHLDIEREWYSEKAKRLIVRWGNLTGFWRHQGWVVIEK